MRVGTPSTTKACGASHTRRSVSVETDLTTKRHNRQRCTLLTIACPLQLEQAMSEARRKFVNARGQVAMDGFISMAATRPWSLLLNTQVGLIQPHSAAAAHCCTSVARRMRPSLEPSTLVPAPHLHPERYTHIASPSRPPRTLSASLPTLTVTHLRTLSRTLSRLSPPRTATSIMCLPLVNSETVPAFHQTHTR